MESQMEESEKEQEGIQMSYIQILNAINVKAKAPNTLMRGLQNFIDEDEAKRLGNWFMKVEVSWHKWIRSLDLFVEL